MFKMGKVEELMQGMEICGDEIEGEEFDMGEEIRNDGRKRGLKSNVNCVSRWSMLPHVRKVLATESTVGQLIDSKLNQL